MGWSTHTTGNVSVSTQPLRKSSNGADKKLNTVPAIQRKQKTMRALKNYATH